MHGSTTKLSQAIGSKIIISFCMKCQLIWSSSGIERSIEFEQGTDLETLKYLVFSVIPDNNVELSSEEGIIDPIDSIVFLDYCGREISSEEDLQFTILENQPIPISSNTMTEINDDNTSYFTIYCSIKNRLNQSNICTRTTFQNQEIIQPGYRLIDTDFLFCNYCQLFVDPSLIVPEIRSLPRFYCRYEEAVTIGLCQTIPSFSNSNAVSENSFIYPETIHSHRLLFERALTMQSYYPQVIAQQRQRFDARLASGSTTILSYENKQWQDQARAVVDYEAIRAYASEKMTTEPTLAKYVYMLYNIKL